MHTGGRIVIDVEDDGLGIDAEAVFRRAREQDIIGPDETLLREGIADLILTPGFSTSQHRHRALGERRRHGRREADRREAARVRRRHQRAGRGNDGAPDPCRSRWRSSTGCSFASAASATSSPPWRSCAASESPPATSPACWGGRSCCPHRRACLAHPACGSCSRWTAPTTDTEDDLVTIVSAADGSSQAGLVVSELLGQHQIVMKSLGDGLGDVYGISGAAILAGRHRGGLVIDVQQTRASRARKKGVNGMAAEATASAAHALGGF